MRTSAPAPILLPGNSGAGRDERLVLDGAAVDVGVRADHHGGPDPGGVPPASADERVLHDYRVRADDDSAVLGRENGTVKNPRPGGDADVADDGRRRGDVGGRVDGRFETAMADQHVRAPLLAATLGADTHTASRLVDVSPATVLREIDRLEEAGLVSTRRLGNTRLARARTNNPVYAPLAELLAVAFGPLAVLRGLLADVEGIAHAFIYGSWAARYHEQPGSVPGDIDVLVIGDPDRDRLADVVEEAEKTLRREVNVRRVSTSAWADDDGPFKRTVMSSPIVELVENEGDTSGGNDSSEGRLAGR
jgi:DNA-binding transcriptional ArsR family regulator